MKRLALTRKAIWCGAVGSLLGMITALNFLPIQPMGYLATTSIVASPARLASLQSHVITPQTVLAEPNSIAILGFKVSTNDPNQPEELAARDGMSSLQTGVISCYSNQMPAVSDLSSVIETASQVAILEVDQTDELRKLRQDRWRREVAQHSLIQVQQELANYHPESQQGFVRLDPIQETDNDSQANATDISVLGPPRANETDEGSEKVVEPSPPNLPFHSAGFRAGNGEVVELESLRDQLTNSIETLDKEIAAQMRALEKSSEHARGLLEITKQWSVQPVAGRVSLDKAIGLILIGFTCWLGVGFFYLWLARGGGSNPLSVAVWLERLGVPHYGTWSSLPNIPVELEVESDSNFASMRLNRWLEWLSLTLAIWIAVRFAIDPNWRLLILDQPLSGLSRLFSQI